MLRANYNASAPSYLDGFQPFILSVLAEAARPYLERDSIAETIHRSFGINIPSLVVKNLLRTMTKHGLTENVGSEAVAITEAGMETAPALELQIAQYNQRQTELVNAFLLFAEERFPEQLALVSSAPATLLASYFERHAAPLLNEGLRGRKGGAAPSPGADFIVASFVTYLSTSDQVRFGYVVEAAKGAMLSAVLLLDASGLKDSLSDLTLVMDTPVLMDALGFHGDLPRLATEQLITLALDQSAKVVAFDHSVGELDGILEHVGQALKKGSRSRSTSAGFLHFVDIGASPVDVVLLRNKLAELLSTARIEIVGRPDGYYEYGLDEAKLEDLIQSKVNYFQDAARVNDVISLSSTHRLRKGRRDRALERCKAVLVTSNVNLVRGAIEFEERQASFPLAVTTDAVASVLWVRSPAAAPDVPREMLLAAAYSGMQPSPVIWTKYLDEIDVLESTKAVSADEAVILRTSRVSRESLMDETLGQADAVNADSPLVALEKIKSEATAPFVEQVRELEVRAREASTVANTASADWLLQVEARTKAEAELKATRESEAATAARLEEMQLAESNKLHNIGVRSRVVAHRWRLLIVSVARIAALLVLAWATIVFLSLDDPADRTGVVIVGIAGFAALALAVSPPLGKFLDAIEPAMARADERRRLSNMGYSTGDIDDHIAAASR